MIIEVTNLSLLSDMDLAVIAMSLTRRGSDFHNILSGRFSHEGWPYGLSDPAPPLLRIATVRDGRRTTVKGGLVGWARWSWWRDCPRDANHLELPRYRAVESFVHEKFRRRGIATAAVAALLADSEVCDAKFCEIAAFNKPMSHVLVRLGVSHKLFVRDDVAASGSGWIRSWEYVGTNIGKKPEVA